MVFRLRKATKHLIVFSNMLNGTPISSTLQSLLVLNCFAKHGSKSPFCPWWQKVLTMRSEGLEVTSPLYFATLVRQPSLSMYPFHFSKRGIIILHSPCKSLWDLQMKHITISAKYHGYYWCWCLPSGNLQTYKANLNSKEVLLILQLGFKISFSTTRIKYPGCFL